MTTFIKVIEIWPPSADRRSLQLADGVFGDYQKLAADSRTRVFSYDEGLPGKAWSRAFPQIITDLESSYFLRAKDAIEANLTSAIALPIFSGEFLLSVVVFLFGDEQYEAGAIELWSNDQDKADKLTLVEGYYGSLKYLERVSRRMSFAKGEGLPGNVWDYNLPIIVTEPANSSIFLRRGSAENDGISMAFGLPCNFQHNELVLTFLSALDTPIAKRFEIWVPERNHSYLFYHSGKCEMGEDLATLYQDKTILRGEGLVGEAWLSGCPQISRDLLNDGLLTDDHLDRLEVAFILPLIEEGLLRSIVALYF